MELEKSPQWASSWSSQRTTFGSTWFSSQPGLALLLVLWGEMLSAGFPVVARLMPLHGLLFSAAPAGKWNKLVILSAQVVPAPLSLEADFYGNHSSDAQGFHGGLLGFLLVSAGFLLCSACMRSCLKNPNCIRSLRRDVSVNLFASASPFMSESFHRQVYIFTENRGLTGCLVWIEAKLLNWTNSFIISGNCSYKEATSASVFGIPGQHPLLLPVPTIKHPVWSGKKAVWVALALVLSFPAQGVSCCLQLVSPHSLQDLDYFCWCRCDFEAQTGKMKGDLHVLPVEVVRTNVKDNKERMAITIATSCSQEREKTDCWGAEKLYQYLIFRLLPKV